MPERPKRAVSVVFLLAGPEKVMGPALRFERVRHAGKRKNNELKGGIMVQHAARGSRQKGGIMKWFATLPPKKKHAPA